MVLDPDDLTRIVGVLDWEMATVGDPLMDLGASLAYWVDPDDSDALKSIRMQPTTVPGMMTRDEVVAHYAAASGHEIADIGPWVLFAAARYAAIVVRVMNRMVARGELPADQTLYLEPIAPVLRPLLES